MKWETIRWKNGKVELIDQRALPGRVRYVKCATARDIYTAIKNMTVRGAPAIGVAGAYGIYLGVAGSAAKSYGSFSRQIDKTVKFLDSARPTARNLLWALERMRGVAEANRHRPLSGIKKILLAEAHAIRKEDIRMCRSIGRHGRDLIKNGSNVLTHCNAGGLATAGYGTALGVIFSSKNKIKRVFVDETRPVLQGARLTAWELTEAGVPAVLICDNMAASLMAKKEIDAVVVGADRIAANGDTANKIGTYGLAVLAAYHGVPFYVAAPASTFDLATASGRGIPIEERSPEEVRTVGQSRITVKDMPVKNPAFDVTPAKLITAIITERGVIKRPDKRNIEKVIA